MLPKAPRDSFGSLFGGFWTSYCALEQRVCVVCEKVSSQTVSWSEDQGSSIAKPCKPYSRSCKNRRGARSADCPFNGTPKALILPPKTLPSRLQIGSKICVLWHWVSSLGFLVFWCLPEVHFGSLFVPMMGDLELGGSDGVFLVTGSFWACFSKEFKPILDSLEVALWIFLKIFFQA